MSRLAAAVVLAAASVAIAAPAFATKGHPHEPACHPTGKGYVLISPDKASSHIDEALYPNGHYWKHEHSGRHDVYASAGVCPSTPSPTTTGGTPSPTTTTQPTSTPSTVTPTTQTTQPTSPSQSPTSSTSPTQSPSPSTTPDSSTSSTAPTKPPVTRTGGSKPPTRPAATSTSASHASPLRSGPSSTVAPPEELARTGASINGPVAVGIFLVGVGLVVGWFAWALGRNRGEHQ